MMHVSGDSGHDRDSQGQSTKTEARSVSVTYQGTLGATGEIAGEWRRDLIDFLDFQACVIRYE